MVVWFVVGVVVGMVLFVTVGKMLTAHKALEIDSYEILRTMQVGKWMTVSELKKAICELQQKPNGFWENLFHPPAVKLVFMLGHLVKSGYLLRQDRIMLYPVREHQVEMRTSEYALTAAGAEHYQKLRQRYLDGPEVVSTQR